MMTNKLPKPIRPENDDCCGGGGCCPCVWDTYFNALDLWEEQEEKEKALAENKWVRTTNERTD
ncbi:MAG: hypothetical protein JKX87_01890 [Cycloclasticus sp.]|nr:hypothetical protein [Cycloclasticus sp.]